MPPVPPCRRAPRPPTATLAPLLLLGCTAGRPDAEGAAREPAAGKPHTLPAPPLSPHALPAP